MLPTEIEHKFFHVQQFSEELSNDSRVDDLTKLEELRKAGHSVCKISTSDEAVSCLQYKLSKLQDFILRKNQTTKDHKLSPI
jgi:hypothetical protein